MTRPRLWLSTQQNAVLAELCADGADNAEIANRLGLTRNTVKTHLKAVMRATGCATRAELAVRALRGQFVVCAKSSEARRVA